MYVQIQYKIYKSNSFIFSIYSKYLEMNGSRDIDALMNRGSVLYVQRKYADALADFDKVLQLDPKHVNGMYDRGLCKDKLGDHEAAIVDFTAAIQLDPKHAAAYFCRACALDSMVRE